MVMARMMTVLWQPRVRLPTDLDKGMIHCIDQGPIALLKLVAFWISRPWRPSKAALDSSEARVSTDTT